MTYTIGGASYQVDAARVPPSLGCPTCGMCVAVVDDVCARCGRMFHPRELWELWDSRASGVREGREASSRATSRPSLA